MLSKIKNLVSEEQGQGMTEYGLLLAVVVVVVVAAMAIFSDNLQALFTKVGQRISAAVDNLSVNKSK